LRRVGVPGGPGASVARQKLPQFGTDDVAPALVHLLEELAVRVLLPLDHPIAREAVARESAVAAAAAVPDTVGGEPRGAHRAVAQPVLVVMEDGAHGPDAPHRLEELLDHVVPAMMSRDHPGARQERVDVGRVPVAVAIRALRIPARSRWF